MHDNFGSRQPLRMIARNITTPEQILFPLREQTAVIGKFITSPDFRKACHDGFQSLMQSLIFSGEGYLMASVAIVEASSHTSNKAKPKAAFTTEYFKKSNLPFASSPQHKDFKSIHFTSRNGTNTPAPHPQHVPRLAH
jgi:hypothetical protein